MEDKYYYSDGTISNKIISYKRLHRENDLPAVERSNGDKIWYIDGKLHREGNKPVFISVSGYQTYYKNHLLHRTNGPAVEEENGNVEYWINGCKYSKEHYLKRLKRFSLELLKEKE